MNGEQEQFIKAYKKNRYIRDLYIDPFLFEGQESSLSLGEVLSFTIRRFKGSLNTFQYTYRFVLSASSKPYKDSYIAKWIRLEDNKTCIVLPEPFPKTDLLTWDYKKAVRLLKDYAEYQKTAFSERL
jgi:hypothetical protein